VNVDNSIRRPVFAAMMAALIAVGAYLSIPIGPVPIVLQNLFVLVAGLVLGRRWAAISVAVYLLAGACGLPVFASGTGGVGRLVGPTGGYLFGFLAAAYLVGMVAEKAGGRFAWEVSGMVVGSLVIYALGVPWLKFVTGMTFGKAMAVGCYPFLIGDALKIAAALPIARTVRPVLHGLSPRLSSGMGCELETKKDL
jgi:biotin transport system substrate-specific component